MQALNQPVSWRKDLKVSMCVGLSSVKSGSQPPPGRWTSCVRGLFSSAMGMGLSRVNCSSCGIQDVSNRYGANRIIVMQLGTVWVWLWLLGSSWTVGKHTVIIHGINIASLKAASRYRDTNCWHFRLVKVANRSIQGNPHRLKTGFKNWWTSPWSVSIPPK